MSIQKPATRPANPRFSSGPCAKIPTFTLSLLQDAALGRSHRAAPGKAKLKAAIDGTRDILGIPQDYKIAIVPASDTGAVEMALWSLLGARKATLLAWESFGAGWVTDVVKQLKIDADVHTADYGDIVDMDRIDYDTDVVFTWNGTTSGVRVKNGDMIAVDVAARTLDLLVDKAELQARKQIWQPPEQTVSRGYHWMSAQHIQQADKGCDFDFLETTFGKSAGEPDIF